MYSYIKFAKQTLLLGVLNALGAIQGIIFLPIITKILGAQDYGIWSQLKITMSVLVPLAFLGLCEAMARFLPGEKDEEKIKEGVYSSLAIVFFVNMALALFLAIFSVPVATFLKFAPSLIRLLSLAIIFESLGSVFLTAVLYRREVGKYFWFSSLKMIGETGLVIAAVVLGYGLYGAVFALLLIRVILFFISLVYIVKKIGVKIPDFSLLKKYLHFGLPTVVNNISYATVTSADRYVIGFFLGVLFVGYYAPAYSVGMFLLFFIIPTVSVLSVVLPKLFDENNLDEVKKYLSNSLKYFLLMMIPAASGLSFLSYQLLAVFSTKEIADNAFMVVPLVAASMFMYGLICFFVQILNLVKKTKLVAIIWAIAAFLNLGLNIVFIPRFGIMAAAIITFISYLCALILTWHYAFKDFQFHIDWDSIVKSIIASALMVLSILWFRPTGFPRVMASVLLGAAVYVILMFLLKVVGKKEVNFFKNIIYEMVFPNK